MQKQTANQTTMQTKMVARPPCQCRSFVVLRDLCCIRRRKETPLKAKELPIVVLLAVSTFFPPPALAIYLVFERYLCRMYLPGWPQLTREPVAADTACPYRRRLFLPKPPRSTAGTQLSRRHNQLSPPFMHRGVSRRSQMFRRYVTVGVTRRVTESADDVLRRSVELLSPLARPLGTTAFQ